MTQEEDQALSRPEYWDARYVVGDGSKPTHEWFRTFAELEPFFKQNLLTAEGVKAEDDPLILHLGTGDSLIPIELASRGYQHQLCVDFSPTAIKLMSERYSSIKSIEWAQADVRNLVNIADGSVDVAFDKGTLDAMIYGSPWSPPDEVRENTSRYMKEVHRTLKDSGRFLYVTFRQAHFMKPLLNPDGQLWDMEMQVLGETGSFDYYGYVIRKRKDVQV
ncbi:hypothetical protein N0V82_001328 [Gnomoniopsis sp. IMI 355080]|nr:hypothetical protein N0V82_001328 [Gnomoniopsis sp. IMI 355080]